jgi:hypothetical protein
MDLLSAPATSGLPATGVSSKLATCGLVYKVLIQKSSIRVLEKTTLPDYAKLTLYLQYVGHQGPTSIEGMYFTHGHYV